MTSFNHYALGAVADWMHRVIGGLAPLEPGYRRVRLAPRPGGGISWASTSLETSHGLVTSQWRLDDGVLSLDVVLPPGVTGVVSVEGHPDTEVSGTTRVVRPRDVPSAAGPARTRGGRS